MYHTSAVAKIFNEDFHALFHESGPAPLSHYSGWSKKINITRYVNWPFLSRHLKERWFSRQQGSFSRVTLYCYHSRHRQPHNHCKCHHHCHKHQHHHTFEKADLQLIGLFDLLIYSAQFSKWALITRLIRFMLYLSTQMFDFTFTTDVKVLPAPCFNFSVMEALTQITRLKIDVNMLQKKGKLIFNLVNIMSHNLCVSPASSCLLLQILSCWVGWTFRIWAGALLETHSRSGKYSHELWLRRSWTENQWIFFTYIVKHEFSKEKIMAEKI